VGNGTFDPVELSEDRKREGCKMVFKPSYRPIARWTTALFRLMAAAPLLVGSGGCSQAATGKGNPADTLPQTVPDLSRDPRVGWLKSHAIPVRSVDPLDEDYSDLEPLKQIIGEARVVFLGEQTHYDALSFLAKTRLVKFLHEEMGFDVLAWESGIYEVNKAWESIENGEDVRVAVEQGIFPAWTMYEETRELFRYVEEASQTDRPLTLAGFDCQNSGTATKDFLLSDMKAFAKDVGLDTLLLAPGTPLAEGVETLGENWIIQRPAEFVAPDSSFLPALMDLQRRISSEASNADPLRTALWQQLVESLIAEVGRLEAQIQSNDTTITSEERDAAYRRMWRARDAQMARNLLWLAETYFQGHKIIGWVATAHAMRNRAEVSTDPRDPTKDLETMGHLVWKEMANEVYVLGFTAYDMSAFAEHPVTDQSPEVEFEELMHATGHEYAIVDFRNPAAGGEWLQEPLMSRPFGNASRMAVLPRIMDGIFFTRDWQPATRIGG
jgi:erythromycin esterase